MKIQMLLMTLFVSLALCAPGIARTVVDAAGRSIELPDQLERVICSGPGCLRMLTYLKSQNMAAAVDSAERTRLTVDTRPYALANPQFKTLPLFGEFRGQDNPELILSLPTQPQVIFKTYAKMGHDPQELQNKTGIPVVVLDYGNMTDGRQRFYASLDIMAEVIGKTERAKAVRAFIDSQISDLKTRTKNTAKANQPSVFVGGVAYKGPHGFQSTEPAYPPFRFVGARNPAGDGPTAVKKLRVSSIAKESILEWDPDLLFLDLSSLHMNGSADALKELKSDPVYQALTAVQNGKVYGVLPYNSYTVNYGSALANAYFVGKTIHPDRFTDIDPEKKANAIYSFLVGEPVFTKMNNCFDHLAFAPVPVK